MICGVFCCKKCIGTQYQSIQETVVDEYASAECYSSSPSGRGEETTSESSEIHPDPNPDTWEADIQSEEESDDDTEISASMDNSRRQDIFFRYD